MDGIEITTLAQTVVDLASSRPLAEGVVAVDAALAGVRVGREEEAVSREQLSALLPTIGRGRAAARFVVGFGDGRSASPGESLSRLGIHRAGLSAPVLQYRLDDGDGAMFADFCWPELRMVGEFDGIAKYIRDEFTQGRDAAEIVIAEKRREDRIRALGFGVVRWGWDVARSVPALADRLRGAGVR